MCATLVFPGNPLVVFGETDGASTGQMGVDWEGENGRQRLEVSGGFSNQPHPDTIRLLRGARLITDLESRMLGSEELRRRNTLEVKELEQLSVTFGLASRAMSLVAVVERAGDHPGEIPQTQVVPVGMPQDMAFGAYFDSVGAATDRVGSLHLSSSVTLYESDRAVSF